MSFSSDARTNSTGDGAWNPPELIGMLRTHTRWWAIPAAVCAVLATGYSLVMPRNWSASQALIIRPEAASVSDERSAKFTDLSEMKTLQETILELTRSQGVVAATLREVGPPPRHRRPELWPSALDIENLRERVDMRPPGGAEFGKTEVFYLSVRDTDRDRASALVAALCGQLELRMKQLRDERAQSMIAELQRTVDMAVNDLTDHTSKLTKFESEIGADLNELRGLNAQIGTQGGLAQELQSIEAERRANQATHQENVRLLKLLSSAQEDSNKLLATPSSLLKSQPAVAQLKDALVAAQIRTASLLGSRSENHPFVIAAREAESSIRSRLYDEVNVAVRGLEVDIALNGDREQALARKWNASRERVARLAGARAEYANLVASVENHSRLVEAARKNLADARARQAGARSASVISRIDGVEAGIYPVGPSRKTVTAAGGLGGLVIGLGLVFLIASPPNVGPAAPITPVAARAAGDRRVSTNGKTHERVAASVSCGPDAGGHPADDARHDLYLFSGMTLEQAIRSVENRG